MYIYIYIDAHICASMFVVQFDVQGPFQRRHCSKTRARGDRHGAGKWPWIFGAGPFPGICQQAR